MPPTPRIEPRLLSKLLWFSAAASHRHLKLPARKGFAQQVRSRLTQTVAHSPLLPALRGKARAGMILTEQANVESVQWQQGSQKPACIGSPREEHGHLRAGQRLIPQGWAGCAGL